MAVKLRMTRRGTTNKPHYRIVATDSRSSRDGRNLEILGSYDPKAGPEKAEFQAERIQYWLSQGAKPSDLVRQILKKNKRPPHV